ncbi:hypothetical protein M3P05_01755 [Sansalvadorimonas sp. 2012CJ34-2]|uniref:Uncharacterized protein n=1 Tax=Parendozoicomonas callyspongiae TaxID=2942213 RepID=A0ABT0PDQ3_9GAMM|nr:hypothetical protein [Sansalvadorimonas sp. 2012CJ34-2]MCL6268678.1 hypothetical protein [Sansalvadorimonas sp. 2012CJ34-2]
MEGKSKISAVQQHPLPILSSRKRSATSSSSDSNTLPPSQKTKTDLATGSCTVHYTVQGETPLFSLSGGRLAPSDNDLRLCFRPEPALLPSVLTYEIQQLGEKLFFLQGVRCEYDASLQKLTLDFTRCQAKGGERCQLPLILCGHLKNKKPFTGDKTNSPSYGSGKMVIDLKLGEVVYTPASGNDILLSLPDISSGNSVCSPVERLVHIYHLLLQRALGEVLYNQRMLERIQCTLNNQQKKALLHELSSFDRLTTEDPDRLGFRLVIKEHEDGLMLNLADLDPDIARRVWGSCNHGELLQKIKGLLADIIPVESTGDNDLVFPVSTHQLADCLCQDVAYTTGVAFLDDQGRILRAPFVLAWEHPWASPGGESKTRLNPLLGALVESHAESGILPANLGYWHRLERDGHQRNTENAVYVVEPPGYDCSEGIHDPGDPILEFDNSQWCWFDFAGIRRGQLGERPLRRECSDIFSYLAFEQKRISTALQIRFPDVTVHVSGADADLAPNDACHGVTQAEPGAGYTPGSDFGIVTLTAIEPKSIKALDRELNAKKLQFETVTESGQTLFRVFDNPYSIYKKLGQSSQLPRHPLRAGTQYPSPYSMPAKTQAEPPSRLGLGEALKELHSLREKLAVSVVHRQHQNPHQASMPGTLESLYPLHIDDSGAGLYCDSTTGRWYYLKPCEDRHAARSEVLMARLAQASGLPVPETGLIPHREQSWVISAWQNNLQAGQQSLLSADRQQLARLFITAAWLGNRNIIGRGSDHAALGDDGCIYGLNWSGAGYFHGNRKRKSPDDARGFFGTVFELEDMCNPGKHRHAAQVFQTLAEEDVASIIPEFLEQAHRQVADLVREFGPESEGERRYLENTLYDRLCYLAIRYPANLPAITGSELAAIHCQGMPGIERPVVSQHIRDQRLIIGHRFNQQGEKETQVSIRLSPEKTTELAKLLELGQAHHDLRDRLEYFLSYRMNGKVMTKALRSDIEETASMAETLKKQLETGGSPMSWPLTEEMTEETSPKPADYISKLNTCISKLNTLSATPAGTKITASYDVKPPPLPVYLPRRVRSDWTFTQPVYEVKKNQDTGEREWHASGKAEIPFAGDICLYRVTLEPGYYNKSLASESRTICLEFHAPDADACSFDGCLRLVATGQDKQTLLALLQWLDDYGLDTRRPDTCQQQQHFEQRLHEWEDGSANRQVSSEKPCWQKHTCRINGRNIPLLPVSKQMDQTRQQQHRPVHELNFHRGTDSVLGKLLTTSATLLNFTDRVSQGQRADGIGNNSNITNNGANLVYTHFQSRDHAERQPHLVFKPWLLNRADSITITEYAGQSQSWYKRHEQRDRNTLQADNYRQFNFTRPVSLPESLESINVEFSRQYQQVLNVFKGAGFDHWPDGRPVQELIKVTRTLKEQYDDYCSSSAIPSWMKYIIQNAGFDQFQQLLRVNPELHLGNLVSLENIFIHDLRLTHWDLSRVCFRNTRLERITLVNCEIAGADLSQCNIKDVCWEYTDPSAHKVDLAWIADALEQELVNGGNPQQFNNLIRFNIDAGRLEKALQLLKVHEGSLGIPGIITHAERILLAKDVDCQKLLDWLRSIRRSASQSEFMTLKLKCAIRTDDANMLATYLEEFDQDELARAFRGLDVDNQKICWLHIRENVESSGNYSILNMLVRQKENLSLLEIWMSEKEHPALHRLWLISQASTDVEPEVLICKMQEAFARFPEAEELGSMTLADLIGIGSSISIKDRLASKGETKKLLELLDTERSQQNTYRRYRVVYEKALALWPGNAELYKEYLQRIFQHSLKLDGKGEVYDSPSENALRVCRQGLNAFKSEPEEQKHLVLLWCEKVTEPSQLTTKLTMIHKYFSPDEAWEKLSAIRSALFVGPSSYDEHYYCPAFYEKALKLWPGNAELYKEYLQRIFQHRLKLDGKGEGYDSPSENALRVCRQGLNAFKSEPEEQKHLVLLWCEKVTELSQLTTKLTMIHKYFSPDEAWEKMSAIRSELLVGGATHKERCHCAAFYEKVLELWPGNAELYKEYLQLIFQHSLKVDGKDNFHNSPSDNALRTCKQGLRRFKGQPEVQKQLVLLWCKQADTSHSKTKEQFIQKYLNASEAQSLAI